MRRTTSNLTLPAFLAAVMVADILALRGSPSFVRTFTEEDGIVEWIGAVALALGAAFTFAAFWTARREPAEERPTRIKRLSYLGLALVLFAAFGEEISWGQRLLGLDTPQALDHANSQHEINLHNLYGDANGQNASADLFKYFWVSFGVALPLAAAVTRRGRALASRYLPVLPVSFALLFVAQQASWHVVRDWWKSHPADWHGTYRSAIEGGPDVATRAAAGIRAGENVTEYRVTTMKQARVAHVSMPGGFGEVAETNVELLLGGGALVLLLGRRRRTDARAVVGSLLASQPRH